MPALAHSRVPDSDACVREGKRHRKTGRVLRRATVVLAPPARGGDVGCRVVIPDAQVMATLEGELEQAALVSSRFLGVRQEDVPKQWAPNNARVFWHAAFLILPRYPLVLR